MPEVMMLSQGQGYSSASSFNSKHEMTSRMRRMMNRSLQGDSSSSDDSDDDDEEEEEEEEDDDDGSNRIQINDKNGGNKLCRQEPEVTGSDGKLLHKRKSMDNDSMLLSDEIKLMKKMEERGHRMLQENEPRWRETVRQQMETELSRRVREALETPPLERIQKRNDQARDRNPDDLNSHLLIDLSDRERDILRTKRWKSMQAKKMADKRELSFVSKKNLEWSMGGLKLSHQRHDSKKDVEMQLLFRDELCPSNQDQYPGVFGLGNLSEGIKNIRDDYSVSVGRYPGAKPKIRHFYTKEGFMKALRSGNLPNGVQFIDDCGTYIDKYGVVRNGDGPFWPVESVPMFPTPRFKWWTNFEIEPFSYNLPPSSQTIDNQVTPYKSKWRGIQVTFDSERSPRDFCALSVPEGCCPSLSFESRFECGNLRQARRIGQFEYELVLKSDLYTARHTQWYYFRVTNVIPGVTYKFRIVNLLKRDSLYNHGMRPLVYSEKDAADNKRGWHRTGHHISYSRNITNHNCPLLQRGISYYMLEWQMEFPHADDTYYLAHCYPYSFTDLKEDLEVMMNSEERAKVTRREVMCETRAGNSCFLLTVSNFSVQETKKAVVITARVHPGESQASWMMKGLLEFITGPDRLAQELRNSFVFKIVPMINPDGVIVGNYRCSLAARDLNRNYRHPRRDNFPTVWYLKNMMEDLARKYEIALYCDLHGHSRKPNMFMYGNNTSAEGEPSALGMARAFISERLFPWLMSERSPDKFAFKSCKFSIRRCKESTGRVVMWRQMGVFNSFTLEATFSGTVLDTDNCRHFNILDFMSMGKTLAQTVLDYSKVQEDEAQQTQTVLDLTRVITEQILVSKGLIEPDTKLPDFGIDKDLMESDAEKVKESAEKWTGALLQLLNAPHDIKKEPQQQPPAKSLDNQPASKSATPAATATTAAAGASSTTESDDLVRPVYTKDDVVMMLGKMTGRGTKSMEDCLGILAQLEAHENLDESDSSDSDSESEPEMKASEPKPRKKKRKSKKHKDGDKKGDKKHGDDNRHKASSALPSLSAQQRQGGSHSANSDNIHMGKSGKQAVSDKGGGSGTSSLSHSGLKQMSAYHSKYEGRHNGGVPCFTEERSMERAAKRMAELRKKHENDPHNRDVEFYCVDDNGVHTLSQEELNQRLIDLATASNSNPATPLLGFNVKTGYTHANNLQDLTPAPNQPLNNVGSFLMTSSNASPTHKQFTYHDIGDHSSSEDSESDCCSSIVDNCTTNGAKFGSRNNNNNNHNHHHMDGNLKIAPIKNAFTTNNKHQGHSNGLGAPTRKSGAFSFPITSKKNPYQHLDPLEEALTSTRIKSTTTSLTLSVQSHPLDSKINGFSVNSSIQHKLVTPTDNGLNSTSNSTFSVPVNYIKTNLLSSAQATLTRPSQSSSNANGSATILSTPAATPRKWGSKSSQFTNNPVNKSKNYKSDLDIKSNLISGGFNNDLKNELKRSKTFYHSTDLSSIPKGGQANSDVLSPQSLYNSVVLGKSDLKLDVLNGAKRSPAINGHYNNSSKHDKKPQIQNVEKLVQQLSENLMGIATPLPIPTSTKRMMMNYNRNSPMYPSRSSRHATSNASSPFVTSGVTPTNRMVALPDCLSPRVDDKNRIGGGGRAHTGVIRSHRPSPGGYQQEYYWE